MAQRTCSRTIAEGWSAREHVRDPDGHLQGACRVFGHAWALLRPDAYLAATGGKVDGSLVRKLSTALATRLETA